MAESGNDIFRNRSRRALIKNERAVVKKGALGLLSLVLILAVIMVVRAMRLPSRQGPPETPVRVAIDIDAAVARFTAAIRIPTVSHERLEDADSAAFVALHEHFARAYPLVHARLAPETVSDLSLLYTWTGSDPDLRPAVLMGHLDVVPVVPGTEKDWRRDPFSGDLVEGEIWGRGTLDDKVSVVSILEAVEMLLAQGFQPRRTIYLAFGHDEERGGAHGAAVIAELLESRGAEPYALVLDEGGAIVRDMIPGIAGAVAVIGIAEKGYVDLELTVDGIGGHSSQPPSQTAIGIVAKAVAALEADPFPARLAGTTEATFDHLAPEMTLLPRLFFGNLWLTRPLVTHMLLTDGKMAAALRTTTAATIINGGVKSNVLPPSARVVVNSRILPGETKESVLERVRTVIDDDRVSVRITGSAIDPSPVSDPDSAAFRVIGKTIRQVMDGETVTVAPYMVMAGTDAKYYSGRSASVFRFLAVPLQRDALELVHGTNERITVTGFMTSVAFFHQLIRNADGL